MKRKSFNKCTAENELMHIEDSDFPLAAELLKLAEHRQKFWKEIEREETYPSLYLEGHYEIIKELCTAILALDGWKALNHECLFAYLKEMRKNLEVDFDYLLELKDIRNSIDYRGATIRPETWKQNKLKISITIRTLSEYVRNQLLTNNRHH